MYVSWVGQCGGLALKGIIEAICLNNMLQ